MSEARPVLADPETLRWFAPTFADEEPDRETGGALANAIRIRERWFLIPADLPAEVSPKRFCARLPFCKPWCLGLTNFRGELVPVYDLGGLIDGGGAATGGYFLVLGHGNARACLCIDEITVVTIPPDTRVESQSTLPNLPDALVCAGIEVEGTLYAEVDLGGLAGILAEQASML